MNLPLRERRWDVFFAAVFALFACTSAISDAIPTLGLEISRHAPTWFGRANWSYGHDTDPHLAPVVASLPPHKDDPLLVVELL